MPSAYKVALIFECSFWTTGYQNSAFLPVRDDNLALSAGKQEIAL